MEAQRKVWSIKDLTKYIKSALEQDAMLQNVWIEGEISNFTHHSSGHMYFTLKDKASRVRCIMFSSHNRRLSFMPKEGSNVLAKGSVSVFERDGQYQFYVTQMQPAGLGTLHMQFEQLKLKLDGEGLFKAEAKKAIPSMPTSVGVITSPTGAAIRDIMITLHRRFPSIPVLLYPVQVQGVQAAPSIAHAIKKMNEISEVDVIIVGRGGGSLEELWAFNEETVARAIFQSHIPIISAVGHETDFTISDFVSDLRAATPTAAAELAVPHRQEWMKHTNHLLKRLHKGLYFSIQKSRDRLRTMQRSPFFVHPQKNLLLNHTQRLDRMTVQLHHSMETTLKHKHAKLMKMEHDILKQSPHVKISVSTEKLNLLKQRLHSKINAVLTNEKQQLVTAMKQLDALSPLKVMDRGFSIVYEEKNNNIIKSIQQVQPGDMVKVKLLDGQLDCHVWSMEGDGTDGQQ
ncbi:exodeoxyribonuclease VII large subunit [Longirhabdus pacifica]|uniref:exodeoxyribonuclease VII large subunit n=1 Tax=Longirhabdus pacifica TaxID=2305227 RepID=UPI001008E298|nr:exodeoxyribonuclease VII large subunit [Longirhabdus pacifica]